MRKIRTYSVIENYLYDIAYCSYSWKSLFGMHFSLNPISRRLFNPSAFQRAQHVSHAICNAVACSGQSSRVNVCVRLFRPSNRFPSPSTFTTRNLVVLHICRRSYTPSAHTSRRRHLCTFCVFVQTDSASFLPNPPCHSPPHNLRTTANENRRPYDYDNIGILRPSEGSVRFQWAMSGWCCWPTSGQRNERAALSECSSFYGSFICAFYRPDESFAQQLGVWSESPPLLLRFNHDCVLWFDMIEVRRIGSGLWLAMSSIRSPSRMWWPRGYDNEELCVLLS